MTDQDFTLLKLAISGIAFFWAIWYCNRVRAQKIKEAQKGINQAFEKCYRGIDQAFDDFESGISQARRPVRRVARPKRVIVVRRRGVRK